MNRTRLQRLLRLKARLRQAVTDELALLQQDLAGVEEAMAAARAAVDHNRVEAARAASEGRSAIDLHLHAAFERAQRAAADVLKKRADEVNDEIAARRTELLDRRREERQLDVLETRARGRTAAAEARGEANFHDDLALQAKRSPRRGEEPTS